MVGLNLNAKMKISILLIGWIAVFYPILPGMIEAWIKDPDNSHALLVPLVSLYFLWKKRGEIGRVSIRGSTAGWMVLVASLAVYLISYAGGIAFFARLTMVTSLIGVVWCCLGRQALRTVGFPLAFLVFMVPVPDTLMGLISFPLQLMATKISAGIIDFCAIPVYREGNMLYFLQTKLEVAEACSGIRSIMSLTMLSAIFAYLFDSGRWQKVVLVLSAVPVALLANIVRVSGTGILAHFFGDQVAYGFLHEFSGMAVFAFGMTVLYLEFQVLNRIGRGRSGDERRRDAHDP